MTSISQGMEFNAPQIQMIKNHIDKHLFILARKVEACSEIERSVLDLHRQLNDSSSRFRLTAPGRDALREAESISGNLIQAEFEIRFGLREIDSIMSVVGANIALLIEQCMIKYDVTLKHWIVRRIKRLVDFREMMMNSCERDFVFPTATAQLAGYIFKTRTIENAERFAIVRNAIRDLVNQ